MQKQTSNCESKKPWPVALQKFAVSDTKLRFMSRWWNPALLIIVPCALWLLYAADWQFHSGSSHANPILGVIFLLNGAYWTFWIARALFGSLEVEFENGLWRTTHCLFGIELSQCFTNSSIRRVDRADLKWFEPPYRHVLDARSIKIEFQYVGEPCSSILARMRQRIYIARSLNLADTTLDSLCAMFRSVSPIAQMPQRWELPPSVIELF